MAYIVIVTSRCYLLCEAINHISVDEVDEDAWEEELQLKLRKKPKKGLKTKKRRPTKAEIAEAIQNAAYKITIDFVPVAISAPSSNSGGGYKSSSKDSQTQVAITVYGRDRCQALFVDIVAQIREQLPDQVFLDSLVEKLLASNNKEQS